MKDLLGLVATTVGEGIGGYQDQPGDKVTVQSVLRKSYQERQLDASTSSS